MRSSSPPNHIIAAIGLACPMAGSWKSRFRGAVRLSVAIQLQPCLDLPGYLRLVGGVREVEGSLGGSDGVVESTRRRVSSGEGVEIREVAVAGQRAGTLGQSHRL